MSDMSDFAGPSGLHLPTFFFFNDTATTEIYTLSLHDALPISVTDQRRGDRRSPTTIDGLLRATGWAAVPPGCPGATASFCPLVLARAALGTPLLAVAGPPSAAEARPFVTRQLLGVGVLLLPMVPEIGRAHV